MLLHFISIGHLIHRTTDQTFYYTMHTQTEFIQPYDDGIPTVVAQISRTSVWFFQGICNSHHGRTLVNSYIEILQAKLQKCK